MLWMLAQLYETLPEAGDLPKPKLCFFFDEAHLLFDDASEALHGPDRADRAAHPLEGRRRLLRDPGADRRARRPVLAQLGNRVQHALRAFTPDDADALRKTARTFPMTEFYDVEKTITSLGTGEALVTVLSPRGVPTPLAATRLLAARLADGAARRRSSSRAGSRPARSRRSTARRSIARAPTRRITARIAAARAAAAEAAAQAAMRGRRATDDRDRDEHDDAGPAAARDRAPGEGDGRRPARRRARAQGRRRRPSATPPSAQQRTIDNAIRTGGKVVTSRLGQDIIRGVFGTLFGGGKSR